VCLTSLSFPPAENFQFIKSTPENRWNFYCFRPPGGGNTKKGIPQCRGMAL